MKGILISIIVAGVLIAGAVLLTGTPRTPEIPVQNVSVVGGTQIVAITAKGGYSPQISTAKAGMPTTLRMETNSTFDCSSAIAIPALGYHSFLPRSGVTDIDVPPQRPGTTLQGICAMGMYNFKVNFN